MKYANELEPAGLTMRPRATDVPPARNARHASGRSGPFDWDRADAASAIGVARLSGEAIHGEAGVGPLEGRLEERWAGSEALRRMLSRWPTAALALGALPMLLFFLLPLLALVARIAPGELLAYLRDPRVAEALRVSVVTTAITLTLTIAGGTPLAYLLARSRFPGRGVLDTLLDLPMVLPPAVAGIALLVTFGRTGLLGRPLATSGVAVAFTELAVVLAQTFVAAPFYVKTAATAFAGLDRELEHAAAVDGAGPLATFARITLPLTGPALIAGGVMTWARALGEFGATLLFAGNFPGVTQTMPLAIYIGFEQDLRISITLAVILLAVSFGVLFLVKAALRQRMAVGFTN